MCSEPTEVWEWDSSTKLAPAAPGQSGPLEFSRALVFQLGGDSIKTPRHQSSDWFVARGVDSLATVLDRGLDANSESSENDLIDDPEKRRKEGWYIFTGSDTWADCNTPLHMAMLSNSMDAAALLLSRGADINIHNARGQTPLDSAVSRGRSEWVEFLLSRGADGDAPTVQSSVTSGDSRDPEDGKRPPRKPYGPAADYFSRRFRQSYNLMNGITEVSDDIEPGYRLPSGVHDGPSLDPPRLPTRVIYLGKEEGSPHLMDANDLCAPYCALAYCRGNTKALATTRASLSSHLREIPVDALPKTPKDAIYAARQLGFEYIWIDALSILQDDEEDWGRESEAMQDVYYNARLILCASDSDDCDGGLFRKRGPGLVTPVQLTVPLSATAWPGKSCMYALPAQSANLPKGISPVDQRAWILQEIFLCARILFLGQNMLRWECLSVTAFETDPDGMNASKPPEEMEQHRAYEASLPYAAWEETVSQYSTRAITKQSDRIPALIGLGRRMESILGDQFVAGVWKQTFCLRSMCWQATSPGLGVEHYPSWSWTSTTSPVCYSMLDTDKVGRGIVTWHASVLECEAQILDPSQSTVRGSIKIKSMTRQGIDEYMIGKVEKRWGYNNGTSCALPGFEYGNPMFLDRSDESSSSGCLCLIIASTRKESRFGSPEVVCLLVRPSDDDDETKEAWRRVDICAVKDTEDFWLGVERRDRIISIV
ncbi:hypothetical protein B0H63DRAFT_546246 [Podospora didyma]|uniref:Heterokaryon incompatibility domain-containing protein n=1 Tax=Podospora didyma TaxID=330526 RepID=A0AAE0TW04_9PEZI|nr:hypothetical protein B0H63DRAFT_546246 [Podospora didyma]